MVQRFDASARSGRRVAATAGTTIALAATGCPSTPVSVSPLTRIVTKSSDSLQTNTDSLTRRDHSPHTAIYLAVTRRLAARCGQLSPAGAESLVTGAVQRLISHGPRPPSVLSVMRVLSVGATPNGPPQARRRTVSALLREVTGTAGSGAPHGRLRRAPCSLRRHPSPTSGAVFGVCRGCLVAGTATWSAAPVRSRRSSGRFDPSLSQPYALATIRRQLLPAGGLTQVYPLQHLAGRRGSISARGRRVTRQQCRGCHDRAHVRARRDESVRSRRGQPGAAGDRWQDRRSTMPMTCMAGSAPSPGTACCPPPNAVDRDGCGAMDHRGNQPRQDASRYGVSVDSGIA